MLFRPLSVAGSRVYILNISSKAVWNTRTGKLKSHSLISSSLHHPSKTKLIINLPDTILVFSRTQKHLVTTISEEQREALKHSS